jgi:hypothetical protein
MIIFKLVATSVRRSCKTLVLLESGVPKEIAGAFFLDTRKPAVSLGKSNTSIMNTTVVVRRSQFQLKAKGSNPKHTSVATSVRLSDARTALNSG